MAGYGAQLAAPHVSLCILPRSFPVLSFLVNTAAAVEEVADQQLTENQVTAAGMPDSLPLLLC